MVNGLVTVVLPIYNVKKYLNRCISSVLNQTYRNIEIILVDDGSTDGCAEICDEWAAKDSRIRVIHKENQGLGMARNTGIDNSTGEFICFFDSDDYIAPETIEKTYSIAKKENADVVLFGMNFVDENGSVTKSFVSPLGNVCYEGKEILNFFLPEFIAPNPNGNGEKLFYMSSVILLYSAKTVKQNNWRFVSEREIISEDVYSLLSFFKYVNKVAVIPEALYYYCRNDSSLSRKYRSDRFEKLNFFYNEAKALCKKLDYSEEIVHRVSKPYLSFVISVLKQESVAPRSKKENKERIKYLINDKTLQEVLKKNKNDRVSLTRKILFFTVRNKMHGLCYLLLKSKSGM